MPARNSRAQLETPVTTKVAWQSQSTMSVRDQTRTANRKFGGSTPTLSVIERTDQQLPRYAEFADSYGGIARGAAPVLNSIARNCATKGQPDLTVLVVRSETGLPGMLDGDPVDSDNPASVQRWHAELQRVREFLWPNN